MAKIRGFVHQYEAEPLDQVVMSGDSYTSLLKGVKDIIARQMELNHWDAVAWYTERYAEVQIWLSETGDELRDKDVYILPYVRNGELDEVWVAKLDNNGTTYYFSDFDISFPGTNMREIV